MDLNEKLASQAEFQNQERSNNDESTRNSDQKLIQDANELLNCLEQDHRTDLATHLYSAYLLKHMLYKANEKRHIHEVDQFYRTQIKDNWTSWPHASSVIDPQTNRIYEDSTPEATINEEGSDSNTLKPGEVSVKALQHSLNMMESEMNAVWQKTLNQEAAAEGELLDLDLVDMPKWISDDIFMKLDTLFQNLHNKVAQRQPITIEQSVSHGNISVVQKELKKKVRPSKQTSLNFHDMIIEGNESGHDMTEIYLKSLQLFYDIPNTFDKSQFKLPKKLLKKYKPEPSLIDTFQSIVGQSREDYLTMEHILNDRRVRSKDKAFLRLINKKSVALGLNKKLFHKMEEAVSEGDSASELYTQKDAEVKIPRVTK